MDSIVFCSSSCADGVSPARVLPLLQRREANTHTQGLILLHDPRLLGCCQGAELRLAGHPGSAGRCLPGLQAPVLAQ